MTRPLTLTVLPGRFAIVRLPQDASIPGWASASGTFLSVTRTADELSVVCDEQVLPPGIAAERDWALLRLEGPFEFSEVGILHALAEPLADAGISIFAISTFDTDYLMVKSEALEDAASVLGSVGHRVKRS